MSPRVTLETYPLFPNAPSANLAQISDMIAGLSDESVVSPSVLGHVGAPPEVYGADGTVTGDSAGLRAAFAGGAYGVDLKPRTYFLDAPALANLAISGKVLRGVKGQTRIQLTSNPTADLLSVLNGSDFSIEDIIFDVRNFLSGTSGMYGGYQIPIYLAQCQRFKVKNCQVLNFYSYGIFANVAKQGRIENNYVFKPTPSGSYANYAIGVGGGAGAALSSDVLVDNNVCEGSDITINMVRGWVTRNDVSGWGYSAGINVAEAPASSGDLIIGGNHVHDPARTPDTFNFYLDCIECWAKSAIIANNNCHGSIGNGISFGGPNSVVTGNICYDNGSVEIGQAGPSGWGIRALADAIDVSGSSVTGNRCFDTRPAGAKMQQYGYGENSTSFTGVKLWGNHFDGNGAGPLDIHSSTVVDGYSGGTWAPIGVGVTFAAASGTYRRGPATTLVQFDLTLPITTDTTPFAFDGLPVTPASFGAVAIGSSPANGLRLFASPGSNRVLADNQLAIITNAALSGKRIVGSVEYVS